MEKDRIRIILDTLAELYPDPLCALEFKSRMSCSSP